MEIFFKSKYPSLIKNDNSVEFFCHFLLICWVAVQDRGFCLKRISSELLAKCEVQDEVEEGSWCQMHRMRFDPPPSGKQQNLIYSLVNLVLAPPQCTRWAPRFHLIISIQNGYFQKSYLIVKEKECLKTNKLFLL